MLCPASGLLGTDSCGRIPHSGAHLGLGAACTHIHSIQYKILCIHYVYFSANSVIIEYLLLHAASRDANRRSRTAPSAATVKAIR